MIRVVAPDEAETVRLIARRMGSTLDEVLGAERDHDQYDQDWLEQRVWWHLEPGRPAEVYVAELHGQVVGHTLVRAESEGERRFGLFSTTYVSVGARRRGVADALLAQGEAWMRAQGLDEAATHTDAHNTPLIELYQRRGYAIVLTDEAVGMIRLARSLTPRG